MTLVKPNNINIHDKYGTIVLFTKNTANPTVLPPWKTTREVGLGYF